MKSPVQFLLLLLVLTSSFCWSENNVYIGGGLTNLQADRANSTNFSIAVGYDFHRWNLKSTKFQALVMSLEAQYSDSISGADNLKNQSLFVVARAYTSKKFYFKLKQGYTNFSDISLNDENAERSHIGLGLGIGYKIGSDDLELEYSYPNKTLHASSFEISYKVHF